MNYYISLDIETTGLDSYFDEIIEIGAIHYSEDEEIDRFQSLINPENDILGFITNLTGITNEMVKDSPSIELVLPNLIEFIGNNILLGHNVNFDINFLYDEALNIFDYKIQNDFIDTMRISRHLFKDFDNHKLAILPKGFNITEKIEHRSQKKGLSNESDL